MIYSFLFSHCLGDGPSGVHCGLGGVDGGHDVCPGSSVEAEGAGDPGHLVGGQHETKSKQCVLPKHHKAGYQNGGLEKSGEAQANDLLTPLHEGVPISPRDGEHIETPHRDLDQQDTAPLQICEKHFDHCVGH